MKMLCTYFLAAAIVPVAERCRTLFEGTIQIPEADVCESPCVEKVAPPAVAVVDVPEIAIVDLFHGGEGLDVRLQCETLSFAAPLALSVQCTEPMSAEPLKIKRPAYDLNGVEGEVADSTILKLTYDALNEGQLPIRSSQWREPLLKMLVGGIRGTDFDTVYKMLFAGFAGPDDRSRIRRLNRWAEGLADDHVRADLFRAETRYWISMGEYELAVDAANRMEAAYPPYVIRACRLRALAHASSGELAAAKADIAAARTHRLPRSELFELLYIEAWIALQEGDEPLAERNLRSIVNETPRSAIARKSEKVLESLKGDAK